MFYLSKSKLSDEETLNKIKKCFIHPGNDLLEHDDTGPYEPNLVNEADVLLVVGHDKSHTIHDEVSFYYLGRGTGSEVLRFNDNANSYAFIGFHHEEPLFLKIRQIKTHDANDWQRKYYVCLLDCNSITLTNIYKKQSND
jgi:hypothetical protein